MEVQGIETQRLALGREAVEYISDRLAEPEWLREHRLRAWETFERTPMPSLQDEEWRRTDIRRLKLDRFSLPVEAGAVYEPESSRDHRSGFMQVVDGFATKTELDPSAARQGVILTTISEAALAYPELVRRHLGGLVSAEYGKFAALGNALGTGVFLYVPKDAQIELPIQLSTTVSAGGSAVFPRTLVIAERYASVTLIDRWYSQTQEAESLSSGVVEVFTGEGAQVRYVGVQEYGRNVWSFQAQRHQVSRDAQNNNLNIGLGARLAKANVEAFMQEQGGSCEMLGLYFGDETQLFDYHTLQDHFAPSCMSDLLYKGVLRDRSRAVFSGLIRVEPGSQKTDAYQTNRNLLLSETSRADSIPNLEIGANDVKCSHGASVGPLDKEHLFYLMARGLSRRDAERMIVDGFFEPLVSRIPLEGVRERLQEAIDQKMD
ncbi:MAG: Fe-S cluster assembly protein SufD [Chloroflexota bacterium]|nr:Fe-S cluster assembly protein SufD [Chloroflexota bacterium]